MSEPRKPAKGPIDDARRDRLGAALRENLKRRKDQARARRDGDCAAAEDAGTEPGRQR